MNVHKLFQRSIRIGWLEHRLTYISRYIKTTKRENDRLPKNVETAEKLPELKEFTGAH